MPGTARRQQAGAKAGEKTLLGGVARCGSSPQEIPPKEGTGQPGTAAQPFFREAAAPAQADQESKCVIKKTFASAQAEARAARLAASASAK